MSETSVKSYQLNLSRHMYNDLRFIHEHHMTVAHLRMANMTTMTAIAARGYLRKIGQGEEAEILLTQAGEDALGRYSGTEMNLRKHEAEITERCLQLLKHTRRVVAMEAKSA